MNATSPDKAITEEISGLIERVTFHNDENGFCVLRVRVRGHRAEVTVIGSLPPIRIEGGGARALLAATLFTVLVWVSSIRLRRVRNPRSTTPSQSRNRSNMATKL
jgi:hypothetical protein